MIGRCITLTDAAPDAHANANESLETGATVDEEVFVPFDDAFLEEYNDRRAACKVP